MEFFSIGEIAHMAGMPASTIRYYEQIDLLPLPARVNGRRQYDSSILAKLRVIRLAQQAGFTISEIDTFLHDFPENTPPFQRWQRLAKDKIPQLEDQIQQIQAMKTLLEKTLECQCATLDDCAGENTQSGEYSSVNSGC